MSTLDVYLSSHFLIAADFAAKCQLSLNELAELVHEQLIPAPSYVVSNSCTVNTFAFGVLKTDKSTNGDYFHPANVAWVKLALQTIEQVGRSDAQAALKQQFTQNFQTALSELNANTWHLGDCYHDDESVIAEGLRSRVDSAWEHFLRGTYGICTAKPSTAQAIARKGVLQEKLTSLTDNGTKQHFTQAEAENLLKLMDDYAQTIMPFSPAEYAMSSRKRLIDDLRPRVLGQLERVI